MPSETSEEHENNGDENERVVVEQPATIESDKIALTFLYKTMKTHPEKFANALSAVCIHIDNHVVAEGGDQTQQENSSRRDSSDIQQHAAGSRRGNRR